MTTGADELSLDALLKYVNALGYETISRNPSSPIRLAPLQLEHRKKLIVPVAAIRNHRQPPTAKFCRWSVWTIDGFPGADGPEPHLTGTKLVGHTSSFQTTSEIVAIGDDLSCVVTKSGKLYEISEERADLTSEGFLQIVSTLISWGYQHELNLPPIL